MLVIHTRHENWRIEYEPKLTFVMRNTTRKFWYGLRKIFYLKMKNYIQVFNLLRPQLPLSKFSSTEALYLPITDLILPNIRDRELELENIT